MIQLHHVIKSFGPDAQPVVNGLTFDVQPGETLVLLGSSGCGKTTTLKLINGLIELTSGRIEVDGRDISETPPIQLRRSMGYVFQGIGLFPHMTVEANAAIVLRLLGRSQVEQQKTARRWLDVVGLDPGEYSNRYPHELSGGQQQRVGVARALAADPDYLLMDEPFGALDAITRDALQQEVITLKRQMNKTILFVTHDLFEALTLADRIAVMDHGRIEQIGPANELMSSPATPFVKDLFDKPKRQLQLMNESN